MPRFEMVRMVIGLRRDALSLHTRHEVGFPAVVTINDSVAAGGIEFHGEAHGSQGYEPGVAVVIPDILLERGMFSSFPAA